MPDAQPISNADWSIGCPEPVLICPRCGQQVYRINGPDGICDRCDDNDHKTVSEIFREHGYPPMDDERRAKVEATRLEGLNRPSGGSDSPLTDTK